MSKQTKTFNAQPVDVLAWAYNNWSQRELMLIAYTAAGIERLKARLGADHEFFSRWTVADVETFDLRHLYLALDEVRATTNHSLYSVRDIQNAFEWLEHKLYEVTA